MSTVYNRRRGAAANASRKPRQCAHVDAAPRKATKYAFDKNEAHVAPARCPRFAPRNRYCDAHQRA